MKHNAQHKPAKIHIEERPKDEEYRVYKVWKSGKRSSPTLITEDLSEAIDEYAKLCKTYSLKADIKLIAELEKNYKQINTPKQNGNDSFLRGFIG